MNEFLKNFIIVNIPYSLTICLLYASLLGYREKMPNKKIALYMLFFSPIEALSRITFTQDIHSVISSVLSIVLLAIIFNIKPIIAFISFLIITFIDLLIQTFFIAIFVFGFNLTTDTIMTNTNILAAFTISYTVSACLIAYMSLKSKYILIDLKKTDVFYITKYGKFLKDKLKALIPIFALLFVINIINFYLYYLQLQNKGVANFLFVLIVSVIFTGIIINLNTKLNKFKNIEFEYKTQQEQLGNIKLFEKGLKQQQHGHLNQLNILTGLLQLGEIESAIEYIASAREATCNLNNKKIPLKNPTILAVINSSVKQAEFLDINISINNKLSEIKLRAFEIGFAINLIIDFIFDYIKNLPKARKDLEIYLYEDEINAIIEFSFLGDKIDETQINDLDSYIYMANFVFNNFGGKIEIPQNPNEPFIKNYIKLYLPKAVDND